MAGAVVLVCAAVLSSNLLATLTFAQLDDESWLTFEAGVEDAAAAVRGVASRWMADEE